MAINDQRINALGGIRNTNRAVHVNGRPVNAPYVVSAIGDPRTLQARLRRDLARASSGSAASTTSGSCYEAENVDDIRLPAAPERVLRDVIELDAEPYGGPARGGELAVIAALGLLLGIIAGLVFAPDVPLSLQNYLPIAVVAALDAVFGGLRAYLDGIFDDKVFVVSFVSNVVIAAAIVYLGDQLGVGSQLSTGVVVVLGIRIFSNVAAIRRHVFHA